jgi:hypothetical protein
MVAVEGLSVAVVCGGLGSEGLTGPGNTEQQRHPVQAQNYVPLDELYTTISTEMNCQQIFIHIQKWPPSDILSTLFGIEY